MADGAEAGRWGTAGGGDGCWGCWAVSLFCPSPLLFFSLFGGFFLGVSFDDEH